MAQPLVSIILPAYNAERTIEECLASLVRQDYPNIEIIVVDDGSTDRTSSILNRLSATYHMRIVNGEHGGRSHAKNMGIEMARGEFIAFAESDAKYDERWVSGALGRFEHDVGGVVGPRYCWSKDTIVSKSIDLKLRLRYHDPSFRPITGWVFNRKALMEVQGFDTKLIVAEDRDIGIRLNTKGYRIVFTPDSVMFHKEPRTLAELIVREFRHSAQRGGFYQKYPRNYPFLRVALSWIGLGLLLYELLAFPLLAIYVLMIGLPALVAGQSFRLSIKAKKAHLSFHWKNVVVASVLDLIRNASSVLGATAAGIRAKLG